MSEHQGYIALVHAVINRAVLDSFLPLVDKKKKVDPLARSALMFLLGDDIDYWLHLIDRDPPVFKKKLVDVMFADTSGANDFDRRNFRINYLHFEKEMANQRNVKDFLKRQEEWTE